jgi:site-specific DNA-methyltransferase (adenine-specific)
METLILGDCLTEMKKLQTASIDAIITDLPYGVTANEADKKLDMAIWWAEVKRLLKPKGTIALTSQFPFTTELIAVATLPFRYDLIWDKGLSTGFLNANRIPLRVHEHILIFYEELGIYNPQLLRGNKNHGTGHPSSHKNQNYGDFNPQAKGENGGNKFPNSIIYSMKLHPSKQFHATEKPLELAEWLVKSYSNEGQTILDTCFGCGWTAVACKKWNRNFIGMEINKKYYDEAKKRVAAWHGQRKIDLNTYTA